MANDGSELTPYQAILLAAGSRRLVRLTYQPPEKAAFERIVACHHLSEHGDGECEYLHAWQQDHPPVHGQGWRSYRLDRILSVQVLDETFTPREPITITDDIEMRLDFFEVNARLQEENEALAESLKRQDDPQYPRQDSNL